MAKKKYNPEWNSKRKIITVSFNEKELLRFEKKYGSILSGRILKEIAFQKELKIHHFVRDETKEELLFQLKKVGNNLNQISWKVQSNYRVQIDDQLKQVDELIRKVEDLF